MVRARVLTVSFGDQKARGPAGWAVVLPMSIIQYRWISSFSSLLYCKIWTLLPSHFSY